jgi:hypothetical protein
MNITPITIDLPSGYQAQLMFRQYQPGGDWICQASDEYLADLREVLQGYPNHATEQ